MKLIPSIYIYIDCCSRLKRSLGEAGEIEPETTSILTEYQVDDDEFPKEVLDCLPKFEDNNDPWKISEVILHTCTQYTDICHH